MKGRIFTTCIIVLSVLICRSALALDEFDRRSIVSFQKTVSAHFPKEVKGKPTSKDIEGCASHLMMIKNGMSLYRDDMLSPDLVSRLRKIIDLHLKISTAACADLSAYKSRKSLALIGTVRDHAEQATRLFSLKRGTRAFEIAMREYHTGIGFNAYNRALDFGVKQAWLDK